SPRLLSQDFTPRVSTQNRIQRRHASSHQSLPKKSTFFNCRFQDKHVEEKPARSTAQSAPSGPAADPHRIYRIS
ncbi:MAG: hypothetical protein J0M24_16875, partial [Verrucomicrobia bacterium]|nr:hypothetical protein [Verrucomicrobiota bacterium]